MCLRCTRINKSNVLDYYWRDYNGTIPHDALVAGQDGQHRNVFIGQAYIRNLGLIVIHITPGEREFYVAVRGVHKVHNHIRVTTKMNRITTPTLLFLFLDSLWKAARF